MEALRDIVWIGGAKQMSQGLSSAGTKGLRVRALPSIKGADLATAQPLKGFGGASVLENADESQFEVIGSNIYADLGFGAVRVNAR